MSVLERDVMTAPVESFSALVTFYEGERCRSQHVSVFVDVPSETPLADLQREAVRRAASRPEVVATCKEWGCENPLAFKGYLVPQTGRFDPIYWQYNKAYKVGECL